MIGVLCSQQFEIMAIGRSRTSMCYATPGHPVQCAARAHKRILSVFAPTMELHKHQIQRSRPNSSPVYVRHRPEKTLLYQIIDEYWPEFRAELASHGKYLPAYVTNEFDEYLKCGILEHGFLRVRCESCHDEKLVAFSCKKRGFWMAVVHGEWHTVLHCW